MGYGYSVRLLAINHAADSSLLGVRLGRMCLENNISVLDVAAALKVSRQTVYNWFCGTNIPNKKYVTAIENYMDGLA